MGNLTVIYYTANAEEPRFEQHIIDNLVTQSSNLPIISVSRKPIELGTNICIGEQPICYSNSWKQLLLGLKEAKTEFCIAAESDCLYPADYFNFIPPETDKFYVYGNVYCFWDNRRKFWRKPRCEGAQMCGREFWIERLERMLGGDTGWEPMDNPNLMVTKIYSDYGSWTGLPVITFKTSGNISRKTSMSKVPPLTELPYWGTADNIYERMFL